MDASPNDILVNIHVNKLDLITKTTEHKENNVISMYISMYMYIVHSLVLHIMTLQLKPCPLPKIKKHNQHFKV